MELLVTLWPSFPHFKRFAKDPRIAGIRLNSAMLATSDLKKELELLHEADPIMPVYFDIKGKQLRVTQVIQAERGKDLVLKLNHPIMVNTPAPVLFKAGEDHALLTHVSDSGYVLTFDGGPQYMVHAGESLHIRDSSLRVLGHTFTAQERQKIEIVRGNGIDRWFLSYVESIYDIVLFQGLVGAAEEICLKIESKAGLELLQTPKFQKLYDDNHPLVVVNARGDLFVELDRPTDITAATRSMASIPDAIVGSRLLLSLVHSDVPSCADLSELAWLTSIGYTRMMLCDELCLKEPLLAAAVNVFTEFMKENHV